MERYVEKINSFSEKERVEGMNCLLQQILHFLKNSTNSQKLQHSKIILNNSKSLELPLRNSHRRVVM